VPRVQTGGHDIQVPLAASGEVDAESLAAIAEKVAARIEEHVTSLHESAFGQHTEATVRETWQKVRIHNATAEQTGTLLCLGIGSPEASQSSAWQLALARLFANSLGISDCVWSDPHMRAVDVAAGTLLGFKTADPEVAPDTLAGDAPLLLYMPHCDRILYERALAANLPIPPGGSTSQLANVVMVGNSFAVYRKRDEFAPPTMCSGGLIQKLQNCTVEQGLLEFDAFPQAFNDLAVLSFPISSLSNLLDIDNL
jgi:hypothetical protein